MRTEHEPAPAGMYPAADEVDIRRTTVMEPRTADVTRITGIGLWSVVRVTLVFYTVMGLALVTAAALIAVVGQASGLSGHIVRLFRSTLGVKSFSIGPATTAAAAAAVAIGLALVGTVLNLVFAVIYNRIADLSGGLAVALRSRIDRRP